MMMMITFIQCIALLPEVQWCLTTRRFNLFLFIPGHQCDINIDDCASSPCKNGATCDDHVSYYSCTCAPGWRGRNCDQDIDECDLGVCQNSVNCANTDGSYTCDCVPGYRNKNCSEDIDECESNPCVNGTCEHLINDYNCSCFPGFEGDILLDA